MIVKVLEASSMDNSNGDKTNNHHKYTLDEVLQAVQESNDGSIFSDLSDWSSHYSEVLIQRLQPMTILSFVPDLFQQKQLADR